MVLDKEDEERYNFPCSVCGRGGIGIRARLRGVSSNGYGFKSRRPHGEPAFGAGSFLRDSVSKEKPVMSNSDPDRKWWR